MKKNKLQQPPQIQTLEVPTPGPDLDQGRGADQEAEIGRKGKGKEKNEKEENKNTIDSTYALVYEVYVRRMGRYKNKFTQKNREKKTKRKKHRHLYFDSF